MGQAMTGSNIPTPSLNHVRVGTVGNQLKAVSGVTVESTETAMRVTDCGSDELASQTFGAISVGTTATNLASLTTNNVDVRARRGIQFKAASGNSGTIVLGGSSVAYNATASSINGMPLAAGDTIFLEVTRLSAIYADASAASQVLHWIAY